MAVESWMRPATTDGVGRQHRHPGCQSSTGARATRPERPTEQRRPSLRQLTSLTAEDEAGEVDRRAAVQPRRRRVTWIDRRGGARATAMIGHRVAQSRQVGAMQVSRSEQGSDGRSRATGG